MRVDVDEAGRDHLAARVDHAARRPRRARVDGDDAAVAQAHVGLARRRAGAVDHPAAADGEVVHRVRG
jgi:hypothetical protein